jgi:putative Ca2+/H+ antiporter (TMEM165/GDT1 family)
MDQRLFLTVFASVFVAEIGDKTQLATVAFSASPTASKWTIFAASATALVLAAGIGVLAGGAISKVFSPRTLSIVAGVGFVAIGLWTLRGAFLRPS